ncbi:cytochrome b/b6 domain-containing protein [Georgenia sp. AZ-5]|uniref:cytochrome b/b6 domain-containing protein n=1 Tax=Georgenia sp. AZ-5 TaxID=3367526 RepID=UPI00375517DB
MTTLADMKKSRFARLVWLVPTALALLVVAVLLARWLRGLPAVETFVHHFPGETRLPESAPVGFPAWLGWQHFLNVFLMVLIIRSGWLIRTTTRPPAYWTRNNKGLLRTRKSPQKMSLHVWFHLSLDVIWISNGLVFIVLMFATGQWMRIVPTSWEVFPNAVSVLVQYLSLDWPTENGWVNYNSLQLLAYFVTIFVAAPLAALTGLRMSPAWPASWKRINRLYPIEVARAIHFPVMLYFVAFIVIHVALVLTTGALRNLNHMYAVRDDAGWLGFWMFAASLAVIVIAWVAARPVILSSVASLTGKISRR